MLLGVFYSTLAAGLLLLATGYLGMRGSPPTGTPMSAWRTVTVVRHGWPGLTLRSETREWTVWYWPVVPRFDKGQEILAAVDPANEDRIYMSSDDAMKQFFIGFVVAILSGMALGFLYTRVTEVDPDAMPSFPVKLTSSAWLFGYLCMAVGAGLLLFSLYRWVIGIEGTPRFSLVGDPFILLLAYIVGGFGLELSSLQVTVTESYLIEKSKMGTRRIEFSEVKSILFRPRRETNYNSRSQESHIVGWNTVFISHSGKELGTLDNNLAPDEEFQKVKNYLFKRFPTERAEE